jgi:uncharacterized protein YggE
MKNVKMNVDLRIVCVVLVLIIGVLVFLWKPWVDNTAARTVDVTGIATVEAVPDEYQFNPSYQEEGADRKAIQKKLNERINVVIEKLKGLGVKEDDIVLASTTYDNYWNDGKNEVTANSLTVTVDNKDLAQKVQDYLVTTNPEGQITPYSTFSEKKRKEVEAEAKSKAIDDAKANAGKMVSQLEVKLGKVMKITDQEDGGVMPMYDKAGGMELSLSSDSAARSSLPVLTGKQDISYSVKVTYEIK